MWAVLLAPGLAFACSVINAPEDVIEVSEAGSTGGSAGLGGLGGAGGTGDTGGVGGTGGTAGDGGSSTTSTSTTSTGGSAGDTSSGGAGGSSTSGGGEGGASTGGAATTGTEVTATSGGGAPPMFDEGLVVVSARTAEAEASEQVLAILAEDGTERARETISVAAIAHDGAEDRDVWFLFVAEDIFPLDKTRPADLEVRRYDPDGPGWTDVSQVSALPPPRAGHVAVLNGYVAYLSYRNSDEAETLTILDTRNLDDIKKLADSAVPPVIEDASQQSLVGLLGARGSPTNRDATGGTLNVMIRDCLQADCPLVVQPLFVGSDVSPGAPVTLDTYNGTPAFASALTERRSFVAIDTGEGVRFFEFDPFDLSDLEDAPVATTTSTMRGLAVLECEESLVLSEGDEERLRGVSTKSYVGQAYDLMRPGQRLYFEPYTQRLLAPYNQDLDNLTPAEGSGIIDEFTLTGNGVSAPTIEPVLAADWAPPADLVPLTLGVRMPPSFSCE